MADPVDAVEVEVVVGLEVDPPPGVLVTVLEEDAVVGEDPGRHCE